MAETARCMKCKKQVAITVPKYGTNKRGVRFVTGKCGKCGTKLYRFLPKA